MNRYTPFRTLDGVDVNASVRFDVRELASWQPEKVQALFGGLAAVLSAANSPGAAHLSNEQKPPAVADSQP
jgi:hypothetical protein